MELNIIYKEDCLIGLKKLPDNSIDCCITSPPYWALRDYDINGQIGLEETFELYIEHLILIFNEVKRVLKKQGTCWIILGDSYYGGGFGHENISAEEFRLKYPKQGSIRGLGNLSKERRNKIGKIKQGNLLSNKCLCLIPARLAIEMINQGWILRNKIIWWKRNAMPQSVKDRFTVDYEEIFFFVKNKKYYFKQQLENSIWAEMDPRANVKGGVKAKSGKILTGNYAMQKVAYREDKKRNMRTVWDILTKPNKEAHFAVFPEELPKRCIEAGCPEKGIVLDPFMGAGTTGMVAKKLGRKYIGFDINPNYKKISEKRINEILI